MMSTDEDGTILYRLPNGQFHREDGPAIETENGTKAWFINGRLHRENGPAMKWSDNSHAKKNEWWLNGIEYSEQEHKYEMRSRKLKMLKL